MDWVQHTDEPVYFYSETDTSTGYLSQWYLCIIKDDDGMVYLTGAVHDDCKGKGAQRNEHS